MTGNKQTNKAAPSEKSRRDLAAGVLSQARNDLRRFQRAKNKKGQQLYQDAFRWVTANEFSWPFSFLNVCRTLNLAPEDVRHDIMTELSLGGLQYWTYYCSRVTRVFCRSMIEFFQLDATAASANETLCDAAVLKTSI